MREHPEAVEGNLPMHYGEQRVSVTIKKSTLEKLKVFGDGRDDWDGILNKALRIIQNSPIKTDDPSRGAENAPVTILEFSDFECYYCMEVLPVIKKVLDVYNGKVRLLFKNYPRTLKHPNALNAHIAALCAKNQGKFWEFHDELFRNQENLIPEVIMQIAVKLGMDMESFKTCLKKEEHILKIFLDKQEGYAMDMTWG
jgi:protein-disulfide isomerase